MTVKTTDKAANTTLVAACLCYGNVGLVCNIVNCGTLGLLSKSTDVRLVVKLYLDSPTMVRFLTVPFSCLNIGTVTVTV